MSRPHVVSSAELLSLRDLELLARGTVEGLRQGLHRSPFHGYSAEFSQYRHYRAGDDLRYVDWKAFGRSDRLYSRQFRETTNLGALIVIDVSRSMNFPTAPRSDVGPSKFALARAAAAVLTTLVIDQGDAAGLLAVRGPEGVDTDYLPLHSSRHHLHRCLAALARWQPMGGEGVASALRRAAVLMRRRGIVIVLSDFYEEESAWREMRRLSRIGHEVIGMQVIAREEETLPAGAAIEFEDLESGARVVADGSALRAEYSRRFQAFVDRTRRTLEREGSDYVLLSTGTALETALRRYLVGRRLG